DGETNLRGRQKAAALIARFGERRYDYAGDSSVDLPVWENARAALLVGASASTTRRARLRSAVAAEFPRVRRNASSLWRLLRPHQWVKNLIVFVPLVTSHRISVATDAVRGILAFSTFCFCASGVYVLNDLVDLDADRSHSSKRLRPLASAH